MGRFLRTLARVGLVEYEPSATPQTTGQAAAPAADASSIDLDAILLSKEPWEDMGPSAAAPMPASSSAGGADRGAHPASPHTDASGIEEGRPLEDIYLEARVPSSPFPVERLIRLLDGLRAMDPTVRRAAVLAMDAADESWTMEDALLDAQRKVKALEHARGQLGGQLAAIETAAQAAMRSQEEYRAHATASIRQQIADLEALLQEEVQKVAQETATTYARLESAQRAYERESARLAQEIARLEETTRTFLPPDRT